MIDIEKAAAALMLLPKNRRPAALRALIRRVAMLQAVQGVGDSDAIVDLVEALADRCRQGTG
jgi:hypothetical protein